TGVQTCALPIYLSTCDTCRRIIDLLDFPSDIIFQDIKSESISEAQLEEMKEMAGSYEALFSKRAMLYKQRNLKSKTLTEDDYKNLILEHYTFLKRPVIINENRIFIGNSTKVVEAAKGSFHE